MTLPFTCVLHQGTGSPCWDGSVWCQTGAHGASPWSTFTSARQCAPWKSLPWSRWVRLERPSRLAIPSHFLPIINLTVLELSIDTLSVVSAFQLATASYPLNPWKRLLGGRNWFTSKTLPGRVCSYFIFSCLRCINNSKILCWTNWDLHIYDRIW